MTSFNHNFKNLMPPKLFLHHNLIDIPNRKIYPAGITVVDGKIDSIKPVSENADKYILPGFIDSHIHIESSMLVPTEFARMAVVHGTVATVSDPHEIANVCGIPGVEYMIQNAAQSPLKFHFGAPSCVPATQFETAGAKIGVEGIKTLLSKDEIYYLSEMMNFPGVLNSDPEILGKIAAAIAVNKPVDGHAPGLKGKNARNYAAAGITTDHECFTAEEALDKIAVGMKILIREGSAAKNFEALIDLLKSHPDKIMFCSDDKHPDDLLEGHINQLVKRALAHDCNLYDTLYAACVHPIEHYNLDVGMLRKGDPADFILIDNPHDFNILATYINGNLVAENGRSYIDSVPVATINNIDCDIKSEADFQIDVQDLSASANVRVIEALDGQLITNQLSAEIPIVNGILNAQPDEDILKIGVVNRYKKAPIAMGFVKNFGLGEAAIASSVAHDSHNIVFVGGKDENICKAVNEIIRHRGGISLCKDDLIQSLPLPIAGLMTDEDGQSVAEKYEQLTLLAREMGSTLNAPFMTLSFMALPVIPSLKMTDKGLFDVDVFQPVELIKKL